jgi:hypothetical protein
MTRIPSAAAPAVRRRPLALPAPALAQCAGKPINIVESSETRENPALCQGETRAFDEISDFPVFVGSTCIAIDRTITHVTEVGTKQCFDVCLQDLRTGDTLQINSTTGGYRFCQKRDGATLSGLGQVLAQKACYFLLADQASGRSLVAEVFKCANFGGAALTARGLGWVVLFDNNLANNTCRCP